MPADIQNLKPDNTSKDQKIEDETKVVDEKDDMEKKNDEESQNLKNKDESTDDIN